MGQNLTVALLVAVVLLVAVALGVVVDLVVEHLLVLLLALPLSGRRSCARLPLTLLPVCAHHDNISREETSSV